MRFNPLTENHLSPHKNCIFNKMGSLRKQQLSRIHEMAGRVAAERPTSRCRWVDLFQDGFHTGRWRDGSTARCLFRAPVEGTRHGKTVLVQLRDTADPETGQRYTVKRYESKKAAKGDSWRHERITLKPFNPDFEPIVLSGADEGELQVVAELVEVLDAQTQAEEA